jgi:hypothetical protein
MDTIAYYQVIALCAHSTLTESSSLVKNSKKNFDWGNEFDPIRETATV